MKLNPVAAGLAGGVVMAIYVAGFTLLSVYGDGYGKEFLSQWIALHPGYEITVKGSAVGAGYGFVEGFVWVYLLAVFYNIFSRG